MPGILTRAQSSSAAGTHLVAVDGRTYPLRSVRIEARAAGGLALSTLCQRFENRYEEALEVHYVLPLPADGAVLGYTVKFGETTIHGVVKPRARAAEEFESALREGRAAALLEEDRDDTFRQRLGSIPPGQDVEVRVDVLHPLAFVPVAELDSAGSSANATWEYRFPTVAGVRYQGTPGRVPDAERLDIDRGEAGRIPTSCSLALTIAEAGIGPVEIGSPSHNVTCVTNDSGVLVTLDDGAPLDRDVVVRWPGCAPDVAVTLVEGGGLEGDDGRYALLLVTPPRAPHATQARDLTLLIDSSGSMSGPPLEWAKHLATQLVDGLGSGDRFEILCFGSQVRRITSGMVAARSKSAQRAMRDLAAVSADGGTEMASAITEALRPLRPDSQRQVVLLTDGMIGFESEVVGNILRRLPAGARVHAVGIGSAPNRTLTRGVARAGRGVESFISNGSDLDYATRALSRATARPVLTEIEVGGSALVTAATLRPRDVFAGQPLVLGAELSPAGGEVLVQGRLAGGTEPWTCRLAVGAVDGSPPSNSLPIGALFGRERIAEVELEAQADPHPQSEIDAIVERIAMRHRIPSRVTSLVAVAETSSVDPLQPRTREILPVEMPLNMDEMRTWAIGGPHYRLAAGMEMHDTMALLVDAGEATAHRSLHDLQSFFPTAGAAAQEPELGEWTIPGARILDWDGRNLTIEFETPHGGFLFPEQTRVVFDDGSMAEARLVSDKSSPIGPHKKMRLVRMSMTLVARTDCGSLRPLRVRWDPPLKSTIRPSVYVVSFSEVGGQQS